MAYPVEESDERDRSDRNQESNLRMQWSMVNPLDIQKRDERENVHRLRRIL